ncbi:hypothetical protein [Pseudophaeobacter sp.]|uniref:hypothetical protein n=1 Tax=Pseudophaeobacter sp. TaxID=1971739 RepID=UPI0032972543
MDRLNRINKKIRVSFFNIEASENFFRSFVSSFGASKDSAENSRIFNLREKKHLIKVAEEHEFSDIKAYAVTVVRERNTWQAKATSSGKISGISLNQGIIGDPYFFYIAPRIKLIMGFTSGPSGSLKGVAKTVLEQFNGDRSERIKLDFTLKKRMRPSLDALPDTGDLHLKISSSSLSDAFEDAPKLVRSIRSDSFLEHNVQLIFNLPFSSADGSSISKNDVVELIDYFGDHDGCTALNVSGEDNSGSKVRLDFGNIFYNYRAEISTRNKFIEEGKSTQILNEGIRRYLDEFGPTL